MEYLNFDLHVEPANGSSYRARVTNDPLGDSASTTFSLPFEETQLENLLLKLDPGRTGTRRIAADPRAGAALALGEGLFDSVFSHEVLLAWSRSKDVAKQRECGLRLRLMLADAPALAGLPWELLYDRRRGSFVALSEKTPVVRYLEVPDPPRPLAVDGSLRILVVVSSPTDLPQLDVEGEWRRFKDALTAKTADGTVQLDRLPSPTIAALSTWLRGHDVHVLHFIGHGGYDRDIEDWVLFFTDRYSRRSPVPPNVLGPFLHDHDPLRLVVLNACHSARVDSTDPYSGMAQGLVQQDCTAVVAMQFPISDSAATEFTGDFYGALADGLPVDQAVTSGRKALLAEHIAEWATPVLFLRSPDGRVFDAISPSVLAERPGPTETGAGAWAALTVPTGEEESPKEGGTEDVVPSAPVPPPPEPEEGGTEDVVPSAPVPPPAEPKRTGLAKRFVVVGVIVAALIVAAVGVVRWRSSAEGAQSPQGQTVQTPPSAGPSATSPSAPAVPAVTAIEVPGNQAWTDARLSCEPGLIFEITATGTIQYDLPHADLAVGPDGSTNDFYHRFNVDGLPDANHASLIGRLDQAQPFVVGLSHTYRCAERGRLFLGINDKGVTNNGGAFTATITPHR
jgi:hypothetical protein